MLLLLTIKEKYAFFHHIKYIIGKIGVILYKESVNTSLFHLRQSQLLPFPRSNLEKTGNKIEFNRK